MGRYLARSTKKNSMTNPTYDVLKFIALVILPALNTFWLSFAPVWDLPYVVQIATTIALVDAFLGAVLKISTDRFHNAEDAKTQNDTPEHLAAD